MSEHEVLVGRHRRITIPDKLGINEGDKLILKATDTGVLMQIITTQGGKAPVELFATYIGSTPDGHAWGVIADINGNIGARVRASRSNFIQRDLTAPSLYTEEKLTKFFRNWKAPRYVAFTESASVSNEYARRMLELREGLMNGTWPKK